MEDSQTLAVVVDEDLPIVGRILHRPAQLVVVVFPLNLLEPLLLVEFAELLFPRHTVVGPGWTSKKSQRALQHREWFSWCLHVGIRVHKAVLVDVQAEGKQAVRLWVKAGHLLEVRRAEQRAVRAVFPAVIHAREDAALSSGFGHLRGVLGRCVDDGESSVAANVVKGALRDRARLSAQCTLHCALF